MYHRSLIRLITVFCIVFIAPLSFAIELSLVADKTILTPGENFSVNINVDDATGLSGATFTLDYPSTVLDLGSTVVTSSFFQTVTDSRPGADPAQIEPWQANTAITDKILLAGAYIDMDPDTGGGGAYTGPQTLFTVNFTVKAGASEQSITLELQQTQLCNGPAGWGTDVNNNGQCDPEDTPENAPILVKSFGKGTPEWETPTLEDDFEVMLDSFQTNPDVSLDIIHDADGDGIRDSVENSSCTDINDDDTDNDGLKDGEEDSNVNGQMDEGETNPCDADSDNDGMPDGWELDNNLNPLVDDAALDSDLDGYSNLTEYRAGTDPRDENSIPVSIIMFISPLLL